MGLKEFVKNNSTAEQRKILKDFSNYIKSLGRTENISSLAKIYETDKWGLHFYTTHYEHHFRPFRNKKIILLEIGVGGHDNPAAGGNSLRMWKKYFPHASINAIDIYDKSLLEEKRIRIFTGSQTDEHFLYNVIDETDYPDIIIDDGSHVNAHVLNTFKILFPLLKDGGIYVIEDTQTSYWPDFGGTSNDLNDLTTICGFFKSLTDCLNHQEYMLEDYESTYFDKKIISMHFYHNLIFIYKGDNHEVSNKNTPHIVNL